MMPTELPAHGVGATDTSTLRCIAMHQQAQASQWLGQQQQPFIAIAVLLRSTVGLWTRTACELGEWSCRIGHS